MSSRTSPSCPQSLAANQACGSQCVLAPPECAPSTLQAHQGLQDSRHRLPAKSAHQMGTASRCGRRRHAGGALVDGRAASSGEGNGTLVMPCSRQSCFQNSYPTATRARRQGRLRARPSLRRHARAAALRVLASSPCQAAGAQQRTQTRGRQRGYALWLPHCPTCSVIISLGMFLSERGKRRCVRAPTWLTSCSLPVYGKSTVFGGIFAKRERKTKFANEIEWAPFPLGGFGRAQIGLLRRYLRVK
jgi:hypothetical protein